MNRMTVAHNVCDFWKDEAQTERTSQAVMGQTVECLAKSNAYRNVRSRDQYQGFVRGHVLIGTDSYGCSVQRQTVISLFAAVFEEPRKNSERLTVLVMSTSIEVLGSRRGFAKIRMPNGTEGFVQKKLLSAAVRPRRGLMSKRTIADVTRTAADIATQLAGTPYLWGGSTTFGIDCSGLMQLAFFMGGVQLLRDAWMQMGDKRFVEVAKGESFVSAKLQRGDLVFFGAVAPKGGKPKVTHVGMILADGRMVHSAGGYGVVIDERKKHRLASSYLGARRLKTQSIADVVARPA